MTKTLLSRNVATILLLVLGGVLWVSILSDVTHREDPDQGIEGVFNMILCDVEEMCQAVQSASAPLSESDVVRLGREQGVSDMAILLFLAEVRAVRLDARIKQLAQAKETSSSHDARSLSAFRKVIGMLLNRAERERSANRQSNGIDVSIEVAQNVRCKSIVYRETSAEIEASLQFILFYEPSFSEVSFEIDDLYFSIEMSEEGLLLRRAKQ